MSTLFCFVVSEDIKADSEPIENNYFRIGYKEIYKAIQESEDHFKRNISLPTQLPPIPFTHSFGRFSDLDGNENDELEIKFINKDLPQNHYSIRIHPIEYGMEINEELIDQKFKLKSTNKPKRKTKAQARKEQLQLLKTQVPKMGNVSKFFNF